MYYNTRVSQTNLYDLQFILDRMAWVACNPYSSGQHDEITTILRLVKFAQQNGFRLLPHKADYKGDTTAHVKFVKYVTVRRVIIVFLSEIWSYRIVIISHLLDLHICVMFVPARAHWIERVFAHTGPNTGDLFCYFSTSYICIGMG